jgi:hypothetical protein
MIGIGPVHERGSAGTRSHRCDGRGDDRVRGDRDPARDREVEPRGGLRDERSARGSRRGVERFEQTANRLAGFAQPLCDTLLLRREDAERTDLCALELFGHP